MAVDLTCLHDHQILTNNSLEFSCTCKHDDYSIIEEKTDNVAGMKQAWTVY